MTFVPANSVNRAQDSLNLNPKVTAQGNVYHYVGAFISTRRINYSYAPAYVQDTEQVERATVRGSNISQHLRQSVLTDFGIVITQTSPYDQMFQCLRKWSQRGTADNQTTVICADERLGSAHDRR